MEILTKESKESFLVDEKLDQLSVQSSELFESANSFLKAVKDRIKEIEAQRTEQVKPLDEEVKSINARFKIMTEFGDRIKVKFENSIKTYLIALQKIEAEKQAEIRRIQLEKLKLEQEALERKAIEHNSTQVLNEAIDKEIAIEIISAKPLEFQKTFGAEVKTTLKQVWRFEIIDDTILAREFLSADESKIQKAIRAGVKEIKGVRIYQEAQLAQRG